MDELTLVMSVVQWGPVDHILSNLEITAGILGMPDVVVTFRRSAVASKGHNDLLGAAAQTLHIAQVTLGDLTGLMLFPLHHVEKRSAINHQGATGLVGEVKWIS